MSLELLQVGHCCHPEAVVTRGRSWRLKTFPAIVGLLKHPRKGYILFDTGYAKRFQDATKPFPERLYRWITPMHLSGKEELLTQLQAKGIAAEDIRYIFISHFHADHIAGLLDFPTALYIFSEVALSSALQRTRFRNLVKGYLPTLIPEDICGRAIYIERCKSVSLELADISFPRCYDIFADGSCIAVELPGHAHGHYGLLAFQNNSSFFLVGDASWSTQTLKDASKPHTIANIIMSNTNQYHKTIDILSNLYNSNAKVTILPYHSQKAYEKFVKKEHINPENSLCLKKLKS